ncbi:protein NRT1/ PTR FAMILY 5.4-like isoform X2 [Quercus robur]|uniref:protein NRT1/ PTR FAMILY 5.4-like isoform X2 n=1 Tax=Quercus robur TaxID=38942 RepID=UPI002163DB3F|nr:protein NRT1/ PTR FAMILY 5.4-like isoform X2 [Quercus robur]
MIMSGRCRRVKEWFRDYIFFNPKAFFILGLVLSHSFAEYAVVSTLIDYLTDNWMKEHLPEAVAIINLQDGVKIVLSLFLAYAADSCMGPMGRFKVVLCTTLAYILGLMLLWCSANNYLSPIREIDVFYAAAVILVVGMAGQEPPLRAFLADQLSYEIENPTEEKLEEIDDRTDILWRVARFSGATIALVSLPNSTWEMAFGVSALVMGANLLLFLFGKGLSCYKPHKPDGSSFGIILRVLKAAIHNRNRNYPQTEKGYYWKTLTQPGLIDKSNGQTHLKPKVPFLRLDKAAVIDEGTPPVSPKEQKEQELPGHLCTAEQVREVKRLFTLIPIWTSFLGCSLVAATGNTFFYEQTSNMDVRIASNIEVPLKVLFALRSIICYIISYMFWSKKARQQQVTRIRIGVGMICSALCCFVAWQVEVRRLYLTEEEKIDPISMSVLWLIPQFILLGLMEGLATYGLQEFFYKHVAISMRSYGPSFSDCVLGLGNFISMPFVLLCRSWFKDSINTSHLDKYYLTLAILSSVFFAFYVNASSSIESVHMGSPSNDEESNESLEDQRGNATEGVELTGIKDGNDYTTRSFSSSLRRRKNVATASTAVRFFVLLKDKLALESPANADSPEITEEPLLQSHASTGAEEVVSE